MATTKKASGTKIGAKRTKTAAAPAGAETIAAAPAKAAPAPAVTPEERHRRIAEAAYFIALKRGFQSDPAENWLEAERQIDSEIRRGIGPK